MSDSNQSRRGADPRRAAEAAFKSATTPNRQADPPRPAPVPNAKEVVSLKIDQDVLHFFQEQGPGWQDRINAALRSAAGK